MTVAVRKLLTFAIGAGLLLGTTAGSCGSPAPSQPPAVELDDFICEGDDHPNEPERRKQVKPSPAKPTPAKPAVTPAKPNPGKTK